MHKVGDTLTNGQASLRENRAVARRRARQTLLVMAKVWRRGQVWQIECASLVASYAARARIAPAKWPSSLLRRGLQRPMSTQFSPYKRVIEYGPYQYDELRIG